MMNDKRDIVIKDICDLIRIPSVLDKQTSCEGSPFGADVSRCLQAVLEKGDSMGFRTTNLSGYIGEMDMGKGEHIIGVLCHSDVVPAGEGWDTNPFEPVVKESRIYGRGSSDDKGPLVLSMHVVKQLMDDGAIPEDVMIRIIVGTNEEEMWEDVNYYKEHRGVFPECSISPDGLFPLIFCEKGLYDVDFVYPLNGTVKDSPVKLESLSGGTARNAVPSSAAARLTAEKGTIKEVAKQLEKTAAEKHIEAHFDITESFINITVQGKNAHAMNPEKGRNAVSFLMVLLHEAIGTNLSHESFVTSYCQHIGIDYLGEKAGFACRDNESGELTFNVGIASMNQNEIRLNTSIRYPASYEADVIKNNINRGFSKSGFDIQYVDFLPPVYFSEDDEMVKILYESYKVKSGDTDNRPIAIGGATYARALPKTIAFGPIFPDEKELAHEPNEYVDINRLMIAGEIYYDTLKKLCEHVSETSK